tara:strand:+ start:10852 stop:11103 length:252 start_codon:yes stop_codon:yes gene_type:complete
METLTLAAIILLPAAFAHGWWVGKKQGISNFISFVYDKRDKFNHTTMKFPNKDEIEFVDTLEYNRLVLQAIDEAIEKQSSREI